MIEDSTKEDSGSYKIRASNSGGEIFSESANVTVLPVEGLGHSQAGILET